MPHRSTDLSLPVLQKSVRMVSKLFRPFSKCSPYATPLTWLDTEGKAGIQLDQDMLSMKDAKEPSIPLKHSPVHENTIAPTNRSYSTLLRLGVGQAMACFRRPPIPSSVYITYEHHCSLAVMIMHRSRRLRPCSARCQGRCWIEI